MRSGDSVLPFVLTDTMGLEAQDSQGAHPDDIVKALEGFLKEKYNFNPTTSAKGEDYRSNPSLNDQAVCMVYVMAADKISLLDKGLIQKLKYIREKTIDLEIPQAIIMTRVDEICPLVKENLQKIYYSRKIEEKINLCSDYVGIPVSHVFPVKNYHKEIDLQNDIDVLILRAFTHIVQIANDKLVRLNETF